jgi:hypothetical protein
MESAMNPFPWRSLSLLILLGCVPPLWAQPASPHVGFVYPAGGQQGTTVVVKLGGQYLDGASSVQISGTGVQAKVLGQTKPLTQREINALQTRLQELEKKQPKTDADRKEIEEIGTKLAATLIKPTPVLAEIVTVEVVIASSAPPGARELRLNATTGMSNPVVFDVGQLPEVAQQKELIDPENTPPRKRLARFVKPKEKPADPDVKVTLPAVLNSQTMPGEVDRYRFPARQGQQLVFNTRARALIPYLADAVPGWFQAALTLYDADGNEVAFSGSFQFRPDPVLAYKVPRDGDYILEVRDSIYRGREDFVYRVEAGELPFITSIFPLGGQAGVRTTVALGGWNLPQSSLTLEPQEMKPGILSLSVKNGDLVSNQVPFSVNTLPECAKREPNHTIATAQKISLPTIINGHIGKPGEWDVYRFEGRPKEAVIAEVRARVLGSPLDSVLKLTDQGGKVLGFNDDREDKGQGLLTHHADSLLSVTLSADGTYYLHIGDAQGHGGPAHAYRLRVSTPRPDFELRVTPCSINARPGSTVTLTVYALRKDGFSQDIPLFLTYSPVDFALGGARVPANQDEVRLTLQVPATVRPKPIHLALGGRANIGGRQVTRPALPAEDMMQAFAYHHLVVVDDLMVIVSGTARARFPARVLENGPVKIKPGGTAQVHIAIAKGNDKIHLVLSDPPEGITLKKTVLTEGGAVLLLAADADKVKPGLRANLIVEAYPEVANKPGGAGKPAQPALGTLPAIPFEVLKPSR